jgi:hypothetical protein
MPFVMIRSIVDNWRIFVILIDVIGRSLWHAADTDRNGSRVDDDNGPSIAEGDVSI